MNRKPSYSELEAKNAELKHRCWELYRDQIDKTDLASFVADFEQAVKTCKLLSRQVCEQTDEVSDLENELADANRRVAFAEDLIFKFARGLGDSTAVTSFNLTLRTHNDRLCKIEDEVGLRAGTRVGDQRRVTQLACRVSDLEDHVFSVDD